MECLIILMAQHLPNRRYGIDMLRTANLFRLQQWA